MIYNIDKEANMRINQHGNKEHLQTFWIEEEILRRLERKLFEERKTKKELFLEAIKKYLGED